MKEANFEYSLAAIQKCKVLMAQFISVGVLLSGSLNLSVAANSVITNLAFDT